VPFRWAVPRPSPGLYAVLVADSTWGPRNFRPLYFGKAGNLATRVVRSHEKYDEWCRAAGGAENLYVAYFSMLGSRDDERTTVESGLIRHYGPHCNGMFNPIVQLLVGR
jgi:hypothetical protein